MPGNGRGYKYRDRYRLRYRLLRLTVLYIAVAAAASFAVLFALNGNAEALAAQKAEPTATAVPTATPATTPSPYAYTITGVPKDTMELYFSYNGKYLAYRTGAGITVMDTGANTTLKTIEDPGIQWMRFIENREIVLYITMEGNTVAVSTYNIQSGAQARQASITVPANSKVKSAAFSSMRNYLCVDVQTGTDSFSDEVYTVDIMKRTARLTLQDVINNLVLTRRTNQVYYTNSKGILYLGDKALNDAGEGKLLGPDGKDRMYFQSAADRSAISVIADGKRESSISLPNVANLVLFYRTDSTLYAVFDGYLVDLSGDVDVQVPFDKGLDFAGIGGKNVFFRNAAGDMLGIEMLS